MIIDKIEQAELDPERDYHLKGDIRRFIRWVEAETDHEERIEVELDAMDDEHPVTRFAKSFLIWEESDGENFEDGMQQVLIALDDLYELARENEWYSVAGFALLKSMEFRAELGGFSPAEKFGETLNCIQDVFRSDTTIHPSNFADHIELMLDHNEEIDPEYHDLLFEILREGAKHMRGESDFIAERRYLHFQKAFCENFGRETSHIETRLIESFKDEFELKESAPSAYRADVLERATTQCQSFLSDELENEWRLEIRRLNKQSFGEMKRREIPLGQDRADEIVEAFESVREEHSSWEALGMLLFVQVGFPDYDRVVDSTAEFPFLESMPKNFMSLEGDTVARQPNIFQDEGDRMPSNYTQELIVENHALGLAIHKLINRDRISEADFYTVLTTISGMSIHDEAYLTDAIARWFDGDYGEAVHLGVPRLESVTANVFEEVGRSVSTNQGYEYEQRNLGGFFSLIENEIDRDFGKYLQFQYTDKQARNIRNKVAHGQLRYADSNFVLAATVIFDIFRVAARISEKYSE